MNATEWMESTDAQAMLECLAWGGPRVQNPGRGNGCYGPRMAIATERKLRLFAVTCHRNHSALITPDEVVDIAERYADGLKSRKTLAQYYTPGVSSICSPIAMDAAQNAIRLATHNQPSDQANFTSAFMANGMRDIFGDPFQSVSVITYVTCPDCKGTNERRIATFKDTCGICLDGKIEQFPRWRTPQVYHIAQAIYKDRQFDRLPILADMMEELGCDQPILLEHMRQPSQVRCLKKCRHHTTAFTDAYVLDERRGGQWSGWSVCYACEGKGYQSLTHTRGCWALDAIRGET